MEQCQAAGANRTMLGIDKVVEIAKEGAESNEVDSMKMRFWGRGGRKMQERIQFCSDAQEELNQLKRALLTRTKQVEGQARVVTHLTERTGINVRATVSRIVTTGSCVLELTACLVSDHEMERTEDNARNIARSRKVQFLNVAF